MNSTLKNREIYINRRKKLLDVSLEIFNVIEKYFNDQNKTQYEQEFHGMNNVHDWYEVRDSIDKMLHKKCGD